MEMLASSTKLSFWNSMPTKGAWPRCMKSVLFLRIRREPDIRQGWAVGVRSRGEAGGYRMAEKVCMVVLSAS